MAERLWAKYQAEREDRDSGENVNPFVPQPGPVVVEEIEYEEGGVSMEDYEADAEWCAEILETQRELDPGFFERLELRSKSSK